MYSGENTKTRYTHSLPRYNGLIKENQEDCHTAYNFEADMFGATSVVSPNLSCCLCMPLSHRPWFAALRCTQVRMFLWGVTRNLPCLIAMISSSATWLGFGLGFGSGFGLGFGLGFGSG